MANRIRELRIAKGLTQKDLADLANVSINTARRWEYGTREPRGKDILALESIFETSVDYLLGEEDVILPLSKRPTDTKMVYVPFVSREHSACSDKEIPAADITSEQKEFIPWSRDDFKAFDDQRPPYAIYVEGDRLESANIHDGDKVIINPADEPAQGQIALVSYHDIFSLKYVYRFRNGDILLQCDTEEIRLSPEEQEASGFEIHGSAIASCHRLRTKPLMHYERRK